MQVQESHVISNPAYNNQLVVPNPDSNNCQVIPNPACSNNLVTPVSNNRHPAFLFSFWWRLLEPDFEDREERALFSYEQVLLERSIEAWQAACLASGRLGGDGI